MNEFTRSRIAAMVRTNARTIAAPAKAPMGPKFRAKTDAGPVAGMAMMATCRADSAFLLRPPSAAGLSSLGIRSAFIRLTSVRGPGRARPVASCSASRRSDRLLLGITPSSGGGDRSQKEQPGIPVGHILERQAPSGPEPRGHPGTQSHEGERGELHVRNGERPAPNPFAQGVGEDDLVGIP